jgi:hypothetical protein
MQTDIYVATAGVAATLLGFTIAALAFLVALPEDRPLLQRIRDEGLHAEILRRFSVSTGYLALAVLVALLGLFADREPSEQLTAETLGAGAYWIWALSFVLVPTAAWLARSLRALARVVPVVVAASRRR